MSDESEAQKCLYLDLLPAEESKLQEIDKEVALFAIQTLGLSMRPTWIGMHTTEGRFVELRVANQDEPFCSIPEQVVTIMTSADIIKGLRGAFQS